MIIYNPHVDDFLAEPLQFRLLKRRALKKYGFLFDEARRNGKTIRVLIDFTASGLVPEKVFHRLPRWLRWAVGTLEFRLWKHINGFGDEIKRVPIPKEPVDEVLLAFSYKAATGLFTLRETTLQHYRAVIFHLSHYFLATTEKARHIRCLSNAYLAGDSDITCNGYFRQYFGWYNKPFLVLPFAVADRFKNQQPWKMRDTKAVATGSFHDLKSERPAHKYTDFISTTGLTTYHPTRLAIYQASDILADWVHCKVSPYREYGKNKFSRLLAHFSVGQKKYFSINIVDLYNQHRYAIVGEELSGFPALGAFEAMASGCVLLAQPQYYEGLGLVPGLHFIEFDGNVEEIPTLIGAQDVGTSAEISSKGAHYVRQTFSSEAVFNTWMERLSLLDNIINRRQ
ncbi:hypothetical protein [Chromobacterium aquaticum]|uniref:Glycosyl transferase family 1 domain-containing protein n=1 Tax=Chromobacterium aquaticum TaxID=467180 RepID=A0ABV8ZNF0_9NEIS|nr:hypothetical protein [Chromobacterium aquaticum]MCD5362342.1 hypothetical protein [Chromobacterium aquaticum]